MHKYYVIWTHGMGEGSYLNVIPNYANLHLKEQMMSNTKLAVVIALLYNIIGNITINHYGHSTYSYFNILISVSGLVLTPSDNYSVNLNIL